MSETFSFRGMTDDWTAAFLAAAQGGRSVAEAWAFADETEARLDAEEEQFRAAREAAWRAKLDLRERVRAALKPGLWLRLDDDGDGVYERVASLPESDGQYTHIQVASGRKPIVENLIEHADFVDWRAEIRRVLNLDPAAEVTVVWDGFGECICDVHVESYSVSAERWDRLRAAKFPLYDRSPEARAS